MKRTLLRTLLFLILFSIPFGTRRLVHQFISGFHEYEAAFVYATDILIILFLALMMSWEKKKILFKQAPLFSKLMLFFLGSVLVSTIFAESAGLAIYSWTRLVILAAFAMALVYALKERICKFRTVLIALVSSAVLQALIALLQFRAQTHIGLKILGEPSLEEGARGLARIPAEGMHLLRGYGTFPHPNVLAAFLGIGFLIAVYFYLEADWTFYRSEYSLREGYKKNFYRFISSSHFFVRAVSAPALFILGVGMALTFSRAGWLSLILALFVWWAYVFLTKTEYRIPIVRAGTVLVVVFLILIYQLAWIVFPRAKISLGEPAVYERLTYIELTTGEFLSRSFTNNLFGIGAGNQVLHYATSDRYELGGMAELWQWQPVHNIYLLIISEIGMIGFLLFTSLMLYAVFRIDDVGAITDLARIRSGAGVKFIRKRLFLLKEVLSFRNLSGEMMLGAALLLFLLLFGLFDHFLWSLQPGRLMLWVTAGIVLGAGILGSSHQPKK